VIELNQKMLILKRIIGKHIFVLSFREKLTLKVTNEECHIK
jgi:hypothetical protein